MPNPTPVHVIGAGAAGLMAAHTAARQGAEVLILEGMPKPGAKILASGGSRCNLTHEDVIPENFTGGSSRVVARLLREMSATAARQFFEDLGVRTKLEPTGKIFPESDSALEVRDALLGAVRGAGVELRCGARVEELRRDGEGFLLELAGGETLAAGRVVLSTGGLSYPTTGSRGDGLNWCEALGLRIVTPIPALVPLVSPDPIARELTGMTLDVDLVLRRGESGRELHRVTGSFLFTHFGYSGPAALNLSRHFLRTRAEGAAWVGASWIPGMRFEEADEWLQRSALKSGRRLPASLLDERLPRRLVDQVLERAGLMGETSLAELPREARRGLARLLTEWPLRVTGTQGFEKAEATAGGVDLSEVDPSTMQCRKVPGLFLCGEVLDVDGMLGGYNFQWAWSSGYVAGRGAARG